MTDEWWAVRNEADELARPLVSILRSYGYSYQMWVVNWMGAQRGLEGDKPIPAVRVDLHDDRDSSVTFTIYPDGDICAQEIRSVVPGSYESTKDVMALLDLMKDLMTCGGAS